MCSTESDCFSKYLGESINNCPHAPDSIEACRTAAQTISTSPNRFDAGRSDGVPEFFPLAPDFSKQRCGPEKSAKVCRIKGRTLRAIVRVREGFEISLCDFAFGKSNKYAPALPMLRVKLVASYERDFGHWTRQSIGRTRCSQCDSIAGMQTDWRMELQGGLQKSSSVLFPLPRVLTEAEFSLNSRNRLYPNVKGSLVSSNVER